jgi:hypothetical protein
MSTHKTRNARPSALDLQRCLKRAQLHEKLRYRAKHLTSSVELDHQVYREFRSRFPSASVKVLRVDELKSSTRWASFIDHFQSYIPDMELMTVLRRDVDGNLSADNVVLVCRGVWLAIEIARKMSL